MNIEDQKIKIDKVSVRGIGKTNEKFLKKQIEYASLFEAATTEEMVKSIQTSKNRLDSLDIFDRIKITIDKSDKDNTQSKLSHFHLIFDLKEKKAVQLSGGVNTDTQYTTSFALKGNLCNIRGRAEKLMINYNHDLGVDGEGTVSFIKPLENMPDVNVGIGVLNFNRDYKWSKIFESTTASFGEIAWITKFGKHKCRLETAFRELKANEDSSVQVMKENGASLKTSFKHSLERDMRNDHIFPSAGYRIAINQEIFTDMIRKNRDQNNPSFQNINLKLEGEFQKAFGIGNISIENNLNFGIIQSLTTKSTNVPICDRFFLGGPLDIRGFELGGIGQFSESVNHQTRSCLGSHKYLKHGFHIYSPLPFIKNNSNEEFSSLFRIHGFLVNSITDWHDIQKPEGSMTTFSNNNYVRQILNYFPTTRCTVGIGIVFKLLNSFRIELNYCMPLKYLAGDKASSGIQFGLGIVYV